MSYLEPLIGRECTRITLDAHAPPIVLWFLHEGPVARIEISGRLTLHMVTAAEVEDDESLYLELAGGARLQVPGDSSLEPWWFDVADDAGAE